MGRPRTRPETRSVLLRLDAALVADVDAAVNRAAGETRTSVMEEAMRLWLNKRLASASQDGAAARCEDEAQETKGW